MSRFSPQHALVIIKIGHTDFQSGMLLSWVMFSRFVHLLLVSKQIPSFISFLSAVYLYTFVDFSILVCDLLNLRAFPFEKLGAAIPVGFIRIGLGKQKEQVGGSPGIFC